jgi:hypothetical protein
MSYPEVAAALDDLLAKGEATAEEHKKALQVAWEQDVAITENLEDVAIDDPEEYARELIAYIRRHGDES